VAASAPWLPLPKDVPGIPVSDRESSLPTGTNPERVRQHGSTARWVGLEGDATLERLEDQIGWYDRKSIESQRRFKLVKGIQMTAAALIPLVAILDVYAAVVAALGASVVLLEGLAQLGQYQQNWTAYRSTCEALKHEKFLFLGEAGPYSTSSAPRALHADRIEGLISQEHAKWVSAREEAAAALEQSARS
jgi:hypothetical protein